MAVVNPSTLKTKFQNGDIPTELDYVDLIDSTHNENLVGIYEPTGTIVSNGNGTEFLANDGTYKIISITDPHNPVTIQDTTSINLTLTDQLISADVNFGTTSGTVSEGNHLHPNYSNAIVSAGIISDPPIITHVGLTATVPTSTVRLFTAPNFIGELREFVIPQTDLLLEDHRVNYIYVDYNNGNPIYKNSTDVSTISESATIPVNTLLVTNGMFHLSHWDSLGNGLVNKLHRRFVKTQRYARESGLALTENAGVITIDAGIVWRGARDFNLERVTSDNADNSYWFFYRHIAGISTVQYPTTAFNNTSYDNGTDLVTLTNDTKFTINWYFRGIEDHKHGYYILGNKEYKDLPTARAETKLPVIPIEISSHAMLVGKLMVQKNSNVVYLESAFDTTFTGAVINEHNDLGGIQGGTTDHFFHTPEEIVLTSPANGEVLVRDNTGIWENKTLLEAGIATSTQGAIAVQVKDVLTKTLEPTGYVNPPVSPTWGGLNTRVLTFTGPDNIMFRSDSFIKSNYSFDANVSGIGKFFFYWESDGNGGIQTNYSTQAWGLDNIKIPIAIIYVSATSVDYGKEWHGCRMDIDTHARLHNVDGIRLQNGGLEVSANDLAIDVGQGTLWDEDLPIVISAQTSVAVSYWSGLNYDRSGLKSEYFAFTGTTPQYNNGGILTNLTNGYFGIYWIIATHRVATPIVSLLHTTQYQTFSEALSGMFHTDIRAVIQANAGGAQELQPIACIVCENVGGVNRFSEIHDLRFTTPQLLQDLNPSSSVHFKDVIIHEMTGNIIGNSHSVKTALQNLDNLLSDAIYYPVSHRLTSANADATLSGNVLSLQTLDNNIAGSVIIDENNAGSDTGFQYRARINVNGSFNTVQLGSNYNGAHNIQIGLVRTDGVTIDPLCYYGTGTGVLLNINVWTNNTFNIVTHTDYIQNDGTNFVEVAYNHTSNGSNAHVLYVDKIALIKTTAGGGTTTSKMSVSLSPGNAELIGSADEPVLIGVGSATASNTHWTELRYSDAAILEAIFCLGSVTTKSYTGGQITIRLIWKAAAITGAVRWQVRLVGRSSGEPIDTTFDATVHAVTATVAGVTETLVYTDVTFLPLATELVAGDILFVGVRRVGTDGADSMVGDAKLVSIGIFEI